MIASYRQIDGPCRLAWSEGWQPLGALLLSSRKSVEFSNDFLMIALS